MGKFHAVTIKPTMTASLQHAASQTFASGDVLFDWTSFDIPKGANRLTGVTALIRGTHGAAQTARAIDLYFAKTFNGSDPGSLGTLNATADGTGYYNNLIGAHAISTNDWKDDLDIMHVVTSGHGAAANQQPNIVLQGEPDSGTNVGYDKLFVAATAGGNLSFSTGVDLDDAVDVSELSEAKITTLDGTACNLAFTVGDVIHAQDDIIVGEVSAVDANNITLRHDGKNGTPADFAAWQVQNGAGAAGDLANNDELYVLSPITLKLSFEK